MAEACRSVEGFADFYQKFYRFALLNGRSDSLRIGYPRQLARLALRYNTLPFELSEEQVHAYLYELKARPVGSSDCTFKHTIYSLRMAYRALGIPEKPVRLPQLSKDKKLPVVLSKAEMRRLLETPKMLKHKLILALLYGCGLRCAEVRLLQVIDFDCDRKMLHVRNGKGKKDRYVPLNNYLLRLLHQYLEQQRPELWLFMGNTGQFTFLEQGRYSQRGLQWMIKQQVQKAGIRKNVSTHTLRHTYATHLLEDGLDIVTIKELLGHSKIETTLVYLHVAQFDRFKSFSPLDTLFQARKPMICPYVQHSL